MALTIVIFVPIFLVVVTCFWLGSSYFKQKQKQQIRSMLRSAEASPAEQRNPNLLRPAQAEDAIAKLMRRFRFSTRINLILEQAGSTSTASRLIASCIVAGMAGAMAGLKFHFGIPAQIAASTAGGLGLITPFCLLLRKRKKTIAAFEEQLPEALDFLSRSMRAGHGLSIAMELLASDSPDPLGRAFRRVSNDMALGSSLQVALGKLNVLVPLVDVRFFVSSVCLQQETGGNLGEILTKLAYIIRERFGLKGKVQAVSAHGRVTGMVLLLMPLGVAAFLLITDPKYLTEMAADPIGKRLIYGAIAGQFLGYFAIKKIVDIKV